MLYLIGRTVVMYDKILPTIATPSNIPASVQVQPAFTLHKSYSGLVFNSLPGLEIRVVLWPQSTKTSVGPSDSAM